MELKQKSEQNVKDYLEAMDKIQIDLTKAVFRLDVTDINLVYDIIKMLEESIKLNEILKDAVSQRAERYLEQDNQRIPGEIKSPAAGDLDKGKDQWRIRNQDIRRYFENKYCKFFKQNFCWKDFFEM